MPRGGAAPAEAGAHLGPHRLTDILILESLHIFSSYYFIISYEPGYLCRRPSKRGVQWKQGVVVYILL